MRDRGWPIVRGTLLAMAVLAACGGEAERPAEGAWEFKLDTAGTGAGARPTTWLRTVGKEGPDGEPQTNEVILSLDCRADHTGATILTEQALRQGTVEVELALDAAPPRRIPGFAGTTPSGGQVVLTIPLDSVLALLSEHQRATVRYADGAGSSRTTAGFTVAGVDAHRASFLAGCAER